VATEEAIEEDSVVVSIAIDIVVDTTVRLDFMDNQTVAVTQRHSQQTPTDPDMITEDAIAAVEEAVALEAVAVVEDFNTKQHSGMHNVSHLAISNNS
jgi:hypothetical protein